MILIQFLICGHTARAVCGLKFERMIRRVKETNPSYRASGMWIEIYNLTTFKNRAFCHTARAVCGLKLCKYPSDTPFHRSYRASGMWIEIIR